MNDDDVDTADDDDNEHDNELPSHRRGTLKGVPTVKSPKHHCQVTFNPFS